MTLAFSATQRICRVANHRLQLRTCWLRAFQRLLLRSFSVCCNHSTPSTATAVPFVFGLYSLLRRMCCTTCCDVCDVYAVCNVALYLQIHWKHRNIGMCIGPASGWLQRAQSSGRPPEARRSRSNRSRRVEAVGSLPPCRLTTSWGTADEQDSRLSSAVSWCAVCAEAQPARRGVHTPGV